MYSNSYNMLKYVIQNTTSLQEGVLVIQKREWLDTTFSNEQNSG